MRDSFDFATLRSQTPKYLGMDSLQQALPRGDAAPAEDDAGMDVDSAATTAALDADVSMAGVGSGSESESESGAAGPAPGAADESSFMHSLMAPTQSGANRALDASEARQRRRRRSSSGSSSGAGAGALPDVLGLSGDLSADAHGPGSAAVATPRLDVAPLPASHYAQPPRAAYDWDVSLPIPAPWQESLPYILSTYLQLLYQASVLALVGYLLHVVKRDVDMKMDDRRAAIIRDASWCMHRYVENRCGTDAEPPHLGDSRACLDLESCMEANPDNVRRLSIYAALVAEVLGEFVQPLTPRTVGVFAIIAAACIGANFAINYVFGFVRARTYLTSHGSSAATKSRSRRSSERGSGRSSRRGSSVASGARGAAPSLAHAPRPVVQISARRADAGHDHAEC